MKFKVNKKYVVDAKSHDEAIKIIKKLQDNSIQDSTADRETTSEAHPRRQDVEAGRRECLGIRW